MGSVYCTYPGAMVLSQASEEPCKGVAVGQAGSYDHSTPKWGKLLVGKIEHSLMCICMWYYIQGIAARVKFLPIDMRRIEDN